MPLGRPRGSTPLPRLATAPVRWHTPQPAERTAGREPTGSEPPPIPRASATERRTTLSLILDTDVYHSCLGMSYIDTSRLEALEALGEQLAAGERGPTLVIGGSGLLAIDVISRSTRDVDVVALEEHGQLVSAEPLPQAIADAAALVARDLGLEPNWLKPGPAASSTSACRPVSLTGCPVATMAPRCGCRSPRASTRSSSSSTPRPTDGSPATSPTFGSSRRPLRSFAPARAGRGPTTCPDRSTMRSRGPSTTRSRDDGRDA